MKCFVLTAICAAVAVAGFALATEKVEDLLEANVAVMTEDGSGSGVLFKNGKASFVWTNGHVVSSMQKVQSVIDPSTGLPRVEISYRDIEIVQLVIQNGRKVGENSRYARVVRFSDPEQDGQDLAL